MVNKLKSRIPYLGNNQALKNHIANALRNAGDLNVVIKNIDAIPKENMDSLTKTGLEKFKNEIIPEVRQIIKETQGETAEQGSKLEQAGAKQEAVKGEAKNQQFNNTNVDYTSAVKNIVERKELALRLDPKADILSAVKDFSKPIKTPIFTSKISVDKMLNHLADKIDGDRRLEYINLVKPTLEKPLFITQESISGAQRFRFFKTFIDEKDKVVKFLNVVEDKNGELIEITATPIKNTDLKNLLKGKVIWGGDTLSDLSTPQTAKQGSEADKAIIPQNSAKNELEIKTYANPHVGAGLAGGTLNAKDENGNFDAEKFAKGFIYGLFGSKVTAATLKKTNPKLYDQIVNIGKDKAGKESLSGRVDKIKMPNMGKFLQKLIADKNISDKTKTQMIEAAKGRYAQEIKNEQTKKAIEASAQKGRDMTPIGRDNLNAEIVEYLTNNRQNVAIDVLSPKIAQKLGFRYANVKRTISGDAVRHTINRHGKDSDLVKKSGQKPVAYDDIAKWAQYADEADVQAITKDNIKQDVLISGKQLSEHYYVVVESIRKKANELAFKTMYFEKGSLKNSEAFKDAQTLLRGYEPDANSFAPLKD
ncbi:PBECR2 nuclease fold domain-containing protein [Campylobacter showae]|uniref:PBECR3 domain-containing polyvalent protein n=1 Tax=Campylobacter showae TaxID=204 RepID=UPI000F07EFDC|nr:PBECR2 nuclease fold domain-containing protein [Campylobacter showae]